MKLTRGFRIELLKKLFATGAAYTVQELAPMLKTTETSASALVRDLRKPQYGCLDIKGYFPVDSKLYHYRMAGPNGRA